MEQDEGQVANKVDYVFGDVARIWELFPYNGTKLHQFTTKDYFRLKETFITLEDKCRAGTLRSSTDVVGPTLFLLGILEEDEYIHQRYGLMLRSTGIMSVFNLSTIKSFQLLEHQLHDGKKSIGKTLVWRGLLKSSKDELAYGGEIYTLENGSKPVGDFSVFDTPSKHDDIKAVYRMIDGL
jgi:hypothetical protein